MIPIPLHMLACSHSTHTQALSDSSNERELVNVTTKYGAKIKDLYVHAHDVLCTFYFDFRVDARSFGEHTRSRLCQHQGDRVTQCWVGQTCLHSYQHPKSRSSVFYTFEEKI